MSSLAAVEAELDAVIAAGVDGLSRGELAEEVQACQRLVAKVAALTAQRVGRFDAEQVWGDDGAVNAATWLRCVTRIAAPTAARQVRHARALRTLPVTAAALAAGELSVEHVGRILAADNPRTRDALRDQEERIVRWARELRFQQFGARLGRWLLEHDPDGAEPAATNNRVALSKTFDGTWRLDGWLDPITGGVIAEELRRREDELFARDWRDACERHGTDSPTPAQLARTPAQRRADALAEMARRSAGLPAGHTKARVAITVLVGAKALEQVCELLDGTPLLPADIARWLPVSLVQRIVFDHQNRPIEASRQRVFQGVLRDAIKITMRECAHELCDLPAQWCQIDHIDPVHRGGTTTYDTGRPACAHHNQHRSYHDHDPPRHDRWTPHPSTQAAPAPDERPSRGP